MYKKEIDTYQEGGGIMMDLDNDVMDIYAEDDMFSREIARRSNETVKRKKGRPRKTSNIMSTYNAQFSGQSVKEFEGMTLVYRCPFDHCSRFYATKLALKRHFLSYVHFSTCEEIDQEYISHTLLTDEQRLIVMRSMSRKFKCPAIDCDEGFDSHHNLCMHFTKWHTALHDTASQEVNIRYNNMIHDLYEWTSVYDECMDVAFHPIYDVASMVPRVYSSRVDKANWRLLSIFDCIGPRPSVKRTQLLSSFREFLMGSHSSTNSNTLLIDENGLRLMIIIALIELMPKGFITTRDYIPSVDDMTNQEDFIPHPSLDEKFLKMATKESVLSMKKYGAVHSSRNYLKKVKMSMRNKDGDDSGDLNDEDGESDRFICQFPGCAKPFASLPAYKYHMHHYEHDLQALVEQSAYIRSVLFPSKGDEHYDTDSLLKGHSHQTANHMFNVNSMPSAGWSNYDRISLKFISAQSSMHIDEDMDMDGQIMAMNRQSAPITNLVYSVNDAIHLLHGYLDQQLPIIISWAVMKKRETVSINTTTNEFTLTLRRGDNVSMIKKEKQSLITNDMINKRRRSMAIDNSSLSTMPVHANVYGNPGPSVSNGMEESVELKSIYSRNKRLGMGSKTVTQSNAERSQFCDYRRVLGVYQQYLRSPQLIQYQQQSLIIHVLVLQEMIDTEYRRWVDYSSARYREDLQISTSCKELCGPGKTSSPLLIVHKGSGDEEPPKGISLQPFTGETLDIHNAIMYNYGAVIKAIEWFPYVHTTTMDYYVAALAVIISSPFSTDGDCLAIWNVSFTMSAESPTELKIDQVWLSWIHQLDLVGEDDNREYVGDQERAAITVSSMQWYPFVLSGNNDTAINGLLAVLVDTYEIYIYSLNKTAIFSSPPNGPDLITPMNGFPNEEPHEHDITASLLRRSMSVEKICKISVESYHISCFSWNKQQSNTIGPSTLTNLTTQIIFGTHEGYIGICDLSTPTVPQMLMLIPGHERLITSIDWSPTNMLSVITSSIDGSVHLWNLADMFHRVGLANGIQPCLSATWLLPTCRPFDQSNNAMPLPPRKHGMESDQWDPSFYILVGGDTNYGKIISATADQKAVQIQGSSMPSAERRHTEDRIWTSVYPNGRNDGCLLAAMSWDGDLEILGCHNPVEVPWTTRYVSSFNYDAKENYFTLRLFCDELSLKTEADEAVEVVEEVTEEVGSSGDNDAQDTETAPAKPVTKDISNYGFTRVRWHPLPLRLLASSSTAGIIQVHVMQ